MHLGVQTSVKKVIIDMDRKFIALRQAHIQQQMGGSNCRLFAIANAAAACSGKDPGIIVYKQKRMREHEENVWLERHLLSSHVEKVKEGCHNPFTQNE